MENWDGKFLLKYKVPSLLVPLLLWSVPVLVTESANVWAARGVPQECVLASRYNSLSAPSLITCALKARTFGATRFGYNNKICDIYEDPNHISLSTIEFEKVMPLDMLEEIASGKEGYASSTNQIKTEERAVDGNTATFFHTEAELNPFLIVDLGDERDIHLVRILSRKVECDGAEIRLGMSLLMTGDFSSYTLFTRYRGEKCYDFNPDFEFLSCYSLGVPGRYISIQGISPVEQILGITELEVYASKKP